MTKRDHHVGDHERHKEQLQDMLAPSRVEAFSDGVMAIIITIMVLEIRVPQGDTLASITPLLPVFLTYAVSFQVIGTYWNNHHHLLRATKRIGATVMWANLHLLFWLSLIPFATGWLGENHGGAWPTALYGFFLLMCAIAYQILEHSILVKQGKDSALAAALGDDWKGKFSLGAYILSIAMAFVNPWISDTLIICVAILWFLPDRRIEREAR